MFINEAKRLALIESSHNDLNSSAPNIEIFFRHFTQAWHNIVVVEVNFLIKQFLVYLS